MKLNVLNVLNVLDTHVRTRVAWLLGLCFVLGLFAQGLGLGLGPRVAAALGKPIGGPGAPISEPPATIGRAEGPQRPGGAVYPVQHIRVRMDHSLHLAQGLQCRQCHTGIDDSRLSSQNDLPTGEACDACHGDQHPRVPEGESRHCADCHTHVEEQRVTATSLITTPRLHFSHSAHLTRGASCESCHGDMTKVGQATLRQLPTEADCLTCHDGEQASDSCSTCHPTGIDGRLRTGIGDDPTQPKLIPRGTSARGAQHDLAFVQDHAGIAKSNPQLCASCHDDNACLDCHAGPIRPMRLHAGDYLTTHALDARAATQDCSSCHRLQTECRACHVRTGVGGKGGDGVGEESAFGVGSPLRFHPSGWAGAPGGAQGHALPAQRNISTCASCHTEDACLSCHATTSAIQPGLGASPHGPGFADSARCTALERRNRRVCLKCHAPGDLALECL